MTEPQDPARLFTRRDGYFLALVIGVTFLARWVYWSAVHASLWFNHPMVDSKNYHQWAIAIQKGVLLGQDVLLHSPLYAFFLAGLYQLAGSAQPALAATVQLFVLGPLTGGLVYWLGRRVFSPGVGLAAGLLQAIYAPLFFQEANLLTTQLIHLLNLLALLAAYWAMEKDRSWAWLLPGSLIGFSVLARPNAILLLLVLGGWIVWRWNQRPTRQMWAALAWLCLSAAVLIAPVTLRNAVVLKEFLPTVGNGGLNFYLGNFRGSTGYHIPQGQFGLSAAEQVQASRQQAEKAVGRKMTYGQASRYWAGQGWREIAADPLRWLGLLSRKTLRLFNAYEYTTSLNYYAVRERMAILRWPWLGFGLLAPLALVGMALARRQSLELFPLYGIFGVYIFTNLALLVSSEYRLGLLPALLLFGGYAVVKLIDRIHFTSWRPLAVWAGLLLLLIAICHLPVVPRSVRDYHLATAYANFGATLAQQGAFLQAAEEFQRAIRRLGNQEAYLPFLNLQLGKCYLNANQPEVALAPLEFAYARQPQDPEVGNTLANALTSLREYQRALVLRKQVVGLAPGNPEYWVNLGVTLLWMGQDLQASEAFARARGLAPDLDTRIEQTRQNILFYRAQ